jgi:hypothetical protein
LAVLDDFQIRTRRVNHHTGIRARGTDAVDFGGFGDAADWEDSHSVSIVRIAGSCTIVRSFTMIVVLQQINFNYAMGGLSG